MLTAIREKATGWIAWAIVILISIPFALWGINSYFEGATKIVVAVANGIEIEKSDYLQALARQQRKLVQMAGRDRVKEIVDSPLFKRQVAESLIDETLEREFTQGQGYRISDEQLNDFIQKNEVFQVDGRFDSERYERLVGNAGLSMTGFETQQRQELTMDQVRSSLVETAFITPTEVDNFLKLLNQRRTAVYAVLMLDKFLQAHQVSDADIAQEYKENSKQYFEPPMVRVEYVELSVERLAKEIAIDGGEARRHYNDAPRRYSKPGAREASHILLSLNEHADPAAEEAARAQAARLASEARGGADFAELARIHSADPGSAERGGDLGVILKGVMVQPFEQAVFALGEGEISEPVRTQYGYHVIKVTRVSESVITPFEEVRDEIEDALRRRAAEAQFVEMAEPMRNIAFEQPDSLAPLRDELGLDIQTSGWFSADNGEGIAFSIKVRQGAFTDEVLVDGLNTDLIEIDPDTLVVMRKIDYRDRRALPLDAVRDVIENDLRNDRAAQALTQAGDAILTELTEGAAWPKLLEKHRLDEATLPAAFDAATDPLAKAVAGKVFAAPRPGAGAPVFGGGKIDPQTFVIYRLDAVQAGDPSVVTEDAREQVKTALRVRQGELLFDSFRDRLRKAADFEIFEDRL